VGVQKTRQVILDFLKRRERATLEDLSLESGLAPMSVRGHLSVLERDGLITYEEVRGKIGRPKFVYSLTDRGHGQFPQSYHTFCNRVLEAVTSVSSDSATELAGRIAEGWADEYGSRVAGKSLAEQVKVLAAIRSEEGAMAYSEVHPDGFLLHQRNCPASCVAQKFPQIICTAEIGFMRRLLGASVERTSWAINGDSTCSYLIRAQPGVAGDGVPQSLAASLEVTAAHYGPAPAE
jgi:predicted ArsR family transcriptional regulator